MPNANKTIVNTVGGELSPLMRARIDLPVYQKGLSICQNYICLSQGGATFRQGSLFVNYTRRNQKAVFIPFQFSDQQAYLIEATNEVFRFYKDNQVITEIALTIESMTNADPGVFTSTAHGFDDGDEVFIDSLTGTTGLGGKSFLVANKTADTFELTTVFGVPLDTTNVGAYTGLSGTVARIYEIDTPYLEEHLPFLQYAQDSATMYITHQEYEPGKLTRTTHTNWTLDNSYVRASDFIASSDDYPRSCAFIDSARLTFGGSKARPSTVWASRSPSPSNGDTRFDDFNDGINPDDAIIFTLTPLHGKVDAIAFLSSTSKFLAVGCFSGIRRVYGASVDEPISPTSITAKSVNTFGCAYTLPVSDGENLFYLQRGLTVMRSLEYDIQIDGYTTTDRNLVAYHLTRSGLKQLSYQQGEPDIIWVTRNDGRLIGLTFKQKEDISGWHRHYIAGNHINDNGLHIPIARVLWTGVMPRPDRADQLWLIIERDVPALGTVRSVEYFADAPKFPLRDDYYSGEDTYDDSTNELNDQRRYDDALYEFQKDSIHLDMSVQYTGSDFGIDSLETPVVITDITSADPGVVTTATDHGFSDGDVVYLEGIVGMVELNNKYFTVADATADTFTLIGNDVLLPEKPRGKRKKKKDVTGTLAAVNGPIDTTALTAYTSDGTAARLGVSITPFAIDGDMNMQATGPIFDTTMIGREIWKSYDVNGDGGGRARITGIAAPDEVETTVIVPFDNTDSIPAGGWLITTDSVSGLDHLEGETVGVIADGGPHVAVVVSDGIATLEGQFSIITVGYGPYTGRIESLNLDSGGVTGSAQAKLRNLERFGIRFLNTVGTQFGTNPYLLEQIPFERKLYDRPTPLFEGQKIVRKMDRWEEGNKRIVIVHKTATPSTVLSFDMFIETSDE